MKIIGTVLFLSSAVLALPATGATGTTVDRSTPEGVMRALVQANAERDIETMGALMAKDPDIIGYTIGGRKYIGWERLAKDLGREFTVVARLELPITELRIWTHGDIAWFAMELDYIRYVESEQGLQKTTIPLRETGVLERRDGQWILVAWHESKRGDFPSTTPDAAHAVGATTASPRVHHTSSSAPALDLSGTWLIEEEDKTYTAQLGPDGSGTYSHKGGTFRTVEFTDSRLLGAWHQTGNDREGGFEVVFAQDGSEARGVWWYTRVGSRNNIPPRLHGGTYVWKRLPSAEYKPDVSRPANQKRGERP